jgi:hypothetical protein
MVCLCHFERRRRNRHAGSPAQLALSVLLLIVTVGLAQDAAASRIPDRNGNAPIASLSPSSLTFASQTVGATSAAQTVTLSNTGNAALSISSITLNSVNSSDFAQTNNCTSGVAAGAKCTISVTFKTTATGSRNAAITITDNASGSPQSVGLMGTGAGSGSAPVAILSSTSVAFGDEGVDTSSSPQIVTLSNPGGTALNITSIAFSGADAIDFTENNTCGRSVAAGGNCAIAIIFKPLASGARAASLTITDNASGSPQAVALSGSGTHDGILSWTASTTLGILGYYIFRGNTSGGESAKPLTSTPITGTTYVDENVTAGAKYYYVVRAVASDAVTESANSEEVSATIP